MFDNNNEVPDLLTGNNDNQIDLLTSSSDFNSNSNLLENNEDLLGSGIDNNSLMMNHSSNNNDENDNSSFYSLTIIDENGNQSNSIDVSASEKEREIKLKQYFDNKIVQLRSQMKLTDEKCKMYHFELEDTLEELSNLKKEKENLINTLNDQKDTISRSKEDLDSTRKNYDTQMSLLTEHVVRLNDQIGKTEEQISVLKSHKVYCGICGIDNTVEWLITKGLNGKRCSRGNHPSSYNYRKVN
eukprot:TRINITY_DN8581_c0_g1_i1.p1 TRINITY_DN8581_c0_g1~~TRINITY_DN8581_c0_g1_i1.p1  ORF type:complete len:242 (+),score=86.65 TRINITY_DN8581_c0_g1_i1:1-726(+)